MIKDIPVEQLIYLVIVSGGIWANCFIIYELYSGNIKRLASLPMVLFVIYLPGLTFTSFWPAVGVGVVAGLEIIAVVIVRHCFIVEW